MSGATKVGAEATADRGIGAGAAASPTGKGAGAIGKRILIVTGGGPPVTFCVVTTVVGGSNNEGILSSKNVGSPRQWPNHVSLWKFSKLMTVRSSRQPCGVTGLKRILWTHCV